MRGVKKKSEAMSRGRRNLITAVIFGLLLPGAVVLDRFFADGFRDDYRRSVIAGADSEKYHEKSFRVVEVIDGDTIDVDIPDGKWPDTRIRLLGIDTPETKHPGKGVMHFGPEATRRTSELVLNKNVTLIIDTVSKSRDRYNRLVCYVMLGDGTVLNERLVEGGYAYADMRFDHSEYDNYLQMMYQAREKGIGLWANVREKDLPSWLMKHKPDILSEVRAGVRID